MSLQLPESQSVWSVPKKLFLLFILSYVFFYMFPYPFTQIPILGKIFPFYFIARSAFTLYIGQHFLGLEIPAQAGPNGSGDTTLSYITLITTIVFSIIATIVLFICTRKQKNYNRLYDLIIIYARYYVAMFMLTYGLSKVFYQQFHYPGNIQMLRTYGQSSPMGLLWTFMGYSKPYTIFTGLGEVLGGALLLFRRTTALGCFVTIFIMVNVVMLNFCYDVPVKISSSHLLLISIFILSPAVKNLLNFFIFHKNTTPLYVPSAPAKKWRRLTGIVCKMAITIVPLFMLIQQLYARSNSLQSYPMDGVYETETFVLNKTAPDSLIYEKYTLLPSTTDSLRWKRLIIENGSIAIISMTDSITYWHFNTAPKENKITLYNNRDYLQQYNLHYTLQPNNHLFLSGFYNSDSINVVLKKKNPEDYPLTKRGFHWINEFPFNR